MRYTALSVEVLAVLLLCSALCEGKSHYDVLGVPETSTATVITKKYRQLAKQLHPDKNRKDPKAQDKFIELSKAYEVLNDERSRSEYDHKLKFGGHSDHHEHQRSTQYDQRESNGYYNFDDEEVYIFRAPDGRTFTRSARDQVHS